MTLLFLIRDNEVLLAMKKRGFGRGRWNGVGGKVEKGETIEHALQRECREEIGVTIDKFKKVAVISFDEIHMGKRESLKVSVYIGTKWTGVPTETEEMKPNWFLKDKLPFEQMWPDDQFWLPQILSGKHIDAEFVLDENEYIVSKNVVEVGVL